MTSEEDAECRFDNAAGFENVEGGFSTRYKPRYLALGYSSYADGFVSITINYHDLKNGNTTPN